MSIRPQLDQEFNLTKNSILTAKFSPDDKNLITAGNENKITFYCLKKTYCYYHLSGHQDIIYCLDYSKINNSNIQFILSASRDKTVRLWRINPTLNKPESIQKDNLAIVYNCHNNAIRFVNTCYDSSMFCTGSDDKTVKIWSTNVPNKRLNTFTGHKNWIKCCKFSKSNYNLIASCADDSKICLYDIRCNGNKGSILKTINTMKNNLYTYLDWHPFSDYYIAIASSNNMIRLYDLRNKAKIIQFYASFSNSVNCVEFNRNGNLMICCSSDTTSKLIDILEGRTLFTIKDHSKPVFTCCFNNQATKFVTAGMDSSLKLWRLNLSTLDRNDFQNQQLTNPSLYLMNKNAEFENTNFNYKTVQEQNLKKYKKSEKNMLNKILNQLFSLETSINNIEQRLSVLEHVFQN